MLGRVDERARSTVTCCGLERSRWARRRRTAGVNTRDEPACIGDAREIGAQDIRGVASLGEDIKKRVLEGMALRRLGTPQDIAHAVAYVSSDDAGFLTGQVICVDGGLTMC